MASLSLRNHRDSKSHGPADKRARRPFRPLLEALEDRLAPAIFSVTNTLDTGAGSLRQAITDANVARDMDMDGVIDTDTIVFNIPAEDTRHFYYRNDNVDGRVDPAMVATTAFAAADDALLA